MSADTAWASPPTNWAPPSNDRRAWLDSPGSPWTASSARPATTRIWRSCTAATSSTSFEQRAPGGPHLVSDVGVRLPATLTATGLALLAALPAEQVRALFPGVGAFVQRDGRGVASGVALRSQLQQVRARGYAVEHGLVTDGLSSIAVPIRDHTDHPLAAVAVTWADRAEDPVVDDAVVDAVQRAATELTRRVRGRR